MLALLALWFNILTYIISIAIAIVISISISISISIRIRIRIRISVSVSIIISSSRSSSIDNTIIISLLRSPAPRAPAIAGPEKGNTFKQLNTYLEC